MEDPDSKGSLAALVALKIVCCAGILFATGALSFGGLMAFFENPVVLATGIILMLVAVRALIRSRATRRQTGTKGSRSANTSGPD